MSEDRFAVSRNDVPFVSIHAKSNGLALQKLKGNSYSGRGYGLGVVRRGDGGSGDRIIVGDLEGHVEVFQVDSGECVFSLPTPPPQCFAVRSVPEWNPEVVYVGGNASPHSRDGTTGGIREYDLAKGTLLGRFERKDRVKVRGIEADLSRSLLLSAGFDRKATIWSKRTRECVSVTPLPTQATCSYYAEDLNLLLIGFFRQVECWDIRSTSKPVQRPGIKNLGSSDLCGIVRVETDTFVSASRELVWWRSDGKVVETLLAWPPSGESQKTSSWLSGVCTIGGSYDDPSATPLLEGVTEFDDRCKVAAVSLLSSSLSDVDEFVQSQGGRVIVIKLGFLSVL